MAADRSDGLLDECPPEAIPIVPIEAAKLAEWLDGQPERVRRWASASGFKARRATQCAIPDAEGGLERVLVGVENGRDPYALAHLPDVLPEGAYRLECSWDAGHRERVALGWALGCYRFDRYRKVEPAGAVLAVPEGCDAPRIHHQAAAVYLVRDLVNTPAQDMMPGELAAAAAALAAEFDARVEQIVGDALLERGYPAVHAVGRASPHPPRLIDLQWGNARHPSVTLVGKGVCFDSGGLDIKSATGMRLMKKDMGGAAHALGVARMVMGEGLPVRLRVLIPAVENAIAADAYRPGDVLATRAGLSVEVDNTDAEGRIVLCDALHEACSESPALVVDFATLTGAARVALGPELPCMFCNDDAVAEGILTASAATADPVWRMPLYAPYREMLDSRVADIVNSAASPYAGALTAALFLQTFVAEGTPWAHFDIMAWNPKGRPGRPEGGEAMGARAVFDYLRTRFG